MAMQAKLRDGEHPLRIASGDALVDIYHDLNSERSCGESRTTWILCGTTTIKGLAGTVLDLSEGRTDGVPI